MWGRNYHQNYSFSSGRGMGMGLKKGFGSQYCFYRMDDAQRLEFLKARQEEIQKQIQEIEKRIKTNE